MTHRCAHHLITGCASDTYAPAFLSLCLSTPTSFLSRPLLFATHLCSLSTHTSHMRDTHFYMCAHAQMPQLRINDSLMIDWEADEQWYAATVVHINDDGTHGVRYDQDGVEESVVLVREQADTCDGGQTDISDGERRYRRNDARVAEAASTPPLASVAAVRCRMENKETKAR